MTNNQSVQSIIETFATDIKEEITREIRDRINSAMGMQMGPSTRAVSRVATKQRSVMPRRAGGKRSPEQLVATVGKLEGYVRKHPGQRIELIAKALGMSTKDLVLPTRKLLESKKIKSRGERRATAYFPV